MSESHEVDNRIQTPELAHHMGYAEYPYMEMAAAALRLGLDGDFVEYVNDAELASIEAGRQFINSVANDLANYALANGISYDEHTPPTVDTLQVAHEKYPGVRVTKDDLIAYAEEQNVTGTTIRTDAKAATIHPNANMAGAVWGSLAFMVDDLRSRGQPYHRRINPLVQVELDVELSEGAGSNSDYLLSISMDSLASLVDEHDRLKEAYPSKKTSTILGKGFGDARFAFIRDFVEYKKVQLAEQADA